MAAAPFASAASELGSGGVALQVHGASSGNWSGYADTQKVGYTFVEANWTEPSYTCDGNSPESSAIWVGIDGYSSSTVEQGGTIAICSGKNQGAHEAWWEMYPTNNVQEVFAIKVGDKIVVEGYRAKDGSRLMDARRVTLPDGRKIRTGVVGGPSDEK